MSNKEWKTKIEEQIRTYILESTNGPGSRLETEEQLASRFGVSRYRVRNVLNGLVQQGIISKTPRRGTFINTFNSDAISNTIRFNYQVSNFNLYESIEARIVIELSTIPLIVKRITPSQIYELEQIVEDMRNNKDVPALADEADLKFHATLLKASGNQLLNSFSEIIAQLFHQVEYRSKYWNTETITRLADEHQQILVSIQEGDVSLAVERLKKHLNYTKKIELNELRSI